MSPDFETPCRKNASPGPGCPEWLRVRLYSPRIRPPSSRTTMPYRRPLSDVGYKLADIAETHGPLPRSPSGLRWYRRHRPALGSRRLPLYHRLLNCCDLSEIVTEKALRPVDDVAEQIQPKWCQARCDAIQLTKIQGCILAIEIFLGDASLQPPQQVLTVALHNNLYSADPDGVDQNVSQTGLNRRMKVNLRLFQEHRRALRNVIQQNQYRQNL